LISNLIKQVYKCKASVILFSKLRKEYGNNLSKANALDCLYLNHGKYALISGMAKKLVKRLPNDIISEKIILSKGNSFYFEAFKLAKIPQSLLEYKNLLIEPSLQTKMLDVFERWNNGKLMKQKPFIRRLFKSKSEVIKDGDFIYIDFIADRFLYNMIRSIVGTLLLMERKDLAPETLKEILESRDKTKAGSTISPEGLALIKVIYNNINGESL
jgi:hypothetical protein